MIQIFFKNITLINTRNHSLWFYSKADNTKKTYYNYQIRPVTEKITIYILSTMIELGALFTVTIISCKICIILKYFRVTKNSNSIKIIYYFYIIVH